MSGKKFVGAIIIAIGLLLLLRSLGVVKVSLWFLLRDYWFVILILLGLGMVFHMKWFTLVLALVGLVIVGLFIADHYVVGTPRHLTQTIPGAGITDAELKVTFGAGKLLLGEGNEKYLVENKVTTSESADPQMDITKNGTKARIVAARRGYVPGGEEKWEMELSPKVNYKINIDYGAADFEADLSSLKVSSIDLRSGAARTSILFGDFPTKLTMETGASAVEFKFPKDAGVMIDMSGGAISSDMNGFRKEGNNYFSAGYKESGENIQVKVKAGASSIKTVFE